MAKRDSIQRRIARAHAVSQAASSRRAFDAQSETERQLHAILDTAVEGIIVIDDRGIIETFNRAAQRMFGYKSGEVIGCNISILMPEPYRGEHDGYLADYMRTGQAKIIGIGREALGKRKNGETFPIELAVSEVRVGKRRTFAGIVRDISERKQMEREILEASEREQRKIGHDLHDGLCQELAGISFLVKSMQQKLEAGGVCTPEQAAQVTELLQDAVRHTRSLSFGLNPVEAQPNGLCVALRSLAESTADMFEITCMFRSPREVEMHDASTATHAYRIAQEAVRDAIRHGKASKILIELTQKPGVIELKISDNGISLGQDGRLREDKVLWMMEHRARVIGAHLRVKQRGAGIQILCEIPNTAS